MTNDPPSFRPPSDDLELIDGIWCPHNVSRVSYPDGGNDACFQFEKDSYWFAHRNACLQALMRRLPPAGTVYDIGGGNGFVTAAMQSAGWEAVLVEPGSGAANALKRGVDHVIWAALEDCGFQDGSLPAVGAFDVVEHIEDDLQFVKMLHQQLAPEGRFYATIPAFNVLWSAEDVYAGHFRRYTSRTWSALLESVGFQVEYVTCLFAWLTLPILLLRAAPFRLSNVKAGSDGNIEAAKADHRLPPAMAAPVARIHQWEVARVAAGKTLPVGSSLLCVARKV